MNYRQMEVFYAVITTGSVTAAAKALNLSQPAATKILRHTEDRLGFQLFHRVKGRLVPTEDAFAILHDVERVFQEVDAVRRTVTNVQLGRSGALSVVGVPPFCHVVIPKAIKLFTQTRPDVKISFAHCGSNALMQYVATQRADIGLSFLIPPHASLRATTLWENDMVCIVPRGHPFASRDHVSVADMEDQPLISYPKDSILQPLIASAFTASRKRIPNGIEATTITSTWALVQQGAGIGIVENISQLGELHDNVEIVPFKPSIPIQMEVLTPLIKPPSRLAQQFVQAVREVLKCSTNPEVKLSPRGIAA